MGFDSISFEKLGYETIDTLSEYFKKCLGRDLPVLPWISPEKRLEQWPLDLEKKENLTLLFQKLIENSNHLHHPGYAGHQTAVTLPLSSLCEAVLSALNNSGAIYEMGPSIVMMERRVIEWMAKSLGMQGPVLGHFTSGGTLGNLTALLSMRSKLAPSVWQSGGQDFSVLSSSQCHYSIDRSAKIMGWGSEGIQKVAHDSNYRMDAKQLNVALERAHHLKRNVLGVVANSCFTATGSFDPLEEMADFCRKKSLWLHVDAAHGATACLSSKYKHLLKGIEKADSIVEQRVKITQGRFWVH